LQAFQNEIKNLSNHNPTHVAKELVQYLLGRYDFYKIIKSNGNVEIISFNITGALKWGKKIPLPSRIINISMKPKSKTTLLLVFDQGWQISFRLHNARTLVEPSLKFDINIIGCPATISRHVTDYK
jgi:hypothetical protein